MANFKALNAASYRLKQRYKDCRRNVKFDDEDIDLVLDFKISDKTGWEKLKPTQARKLLAEDGGMAERMSTADMTKLLSGNVSEIDNEDE